MAQKKPQKQQGAPRPRDAKGRFISAKSVKPVKVTNKKIASPVLVERVKDQKKVLAGKARQATGIKDDKGRFVSKFLANEIKKTVLAVNKIDVSKINADQTEKINQLLKDAKIKPQDVKKFYEKNPLAFEDLKTKATFKGTSKNSNQIEKAIKNYKGKILIQNETGELKEVTQAQAKYKLVRLKNALQSAINLADFAIRPNLTLDGKMILKIPSATKVLKDLREALGLEKNESFDDIDSRDIAEALETILNGYYENENDLFFYIS